MLFYDKLVAPLKNTIHEIKEIKVEVAKIKEPFILKGSFAYVYSLFETSLAECLRQFLLAFPERIPKEVFDIKIQKGVLLDEPFSYNIMDAAIDNYIINITYEKFDEFLKKFSELLSVPDYTVFYSENLAEKKERRNLLIHNNLVINRKYVLNTKCDRFSIGKCLEISKTYLTETIASILEMLVKIEVAFEQKYSQYTQAKVFKDIWYYLFDSPLMIFEKHWIIQDNKVVGYKVDEVKKYANALSTGEKTLLAYLLRNFNSNSCDTLFRFQDIGMQVSIDDSKLAFLIELFNKYPLLLQGDTSKR